MLEKGSNKRIFPVDRHAGMVRTTTCTIRLHVHVLPNNFKAKCRPVAVIDLQAVAGTIADGRQVVNRAFDEAAQYKRYVHERLA